MKGTRLSIEVRPRLPASLAALAEMAEDMLYSWDYRISDLFVRLDPDLWRRCGHNPKRFLRWISQARLDAMSENEAYLSEFQSALDAYRGYHRSPVDPDIVSLIDPSHELVAYFCAEYGFHESLPLYSGGLGILAGDHLKAASDLGVPLVAVGLLYHQGYFTQEIDSQGRQQTRYTPNHIGDLPIIPVSADDGGPLTVRITLPGREVALRIWRVNAGRIRLYLLDSDLPENTDGDRAITARLYGGDAVMRIQQEMVLGIGGVRALRALKLSPSVWHINEGHAALQVIERCREWVARGLDFDSALECVAAGTVFTTHTPVAAGHDLFEPKLAAAHFAPLAPALGIDLARLLGLGVNPHRGEGFNMTALALRGSRFHNGVSRQHGQTASEMETYLWPQIPPTENPMGYVTNGVHVPTFLGKHWITLLDAELGRNWQGRLRHPERWSFLGNIPNHRIRDIRQRLKSELLDTVRRRVYRQCRRNHVSAPRIQRMLHRLSPDSRNVLVLAFARRITQYKRPTLIFADPDRLAALLNDTQRPVLLIFAGKAHPQDLRGQELIAEIHAWARRPEFEGRLLFVEDYDMAFGRRLMRGADILLNTPEHKMEASGTSGQKAGINGVLNLSTPVGWWAEGGKGDNGWTVPVPDPKETPENREREEANALYDTLEQQAIPLFFDAAGKGYADGWISKVKQSVMSIIPGFSSHRMMMDYLARYYAPAAKKERQLASEEGRNAVNLARWKASVAEWWSEVSLSLAEPAPEAVHSGEPLRLRVAVRLDRLTPKDIVVECLMGDAPDGIGFRVRERVVLHPESGDPADPVIYRLETIPPLSGRQYYHIRAYPFHEHLSHPFETGRMVWL